MADPVRPLDGVLVADHSILGPGAYATELLARLGARVIKFEPPAGDPARRIPGLWRSLNSGKESVVCDLQTDGGLSLARAVAASADVFVESWRPSVAERLGMTSGVLRSINPRLVCCTVSGFGSDSPLRDRAGHELNYLAASGALRGIFGESSQFPHIPIGDTAAGAFAALRIVSAVLAARATGAGTAIEVAVSGVLAEFSAIGASAAGSPLGADTRSAAYGVFSTADGRSVALGVLDEPPFWRALCSALSLDDVRGLSSLDLANQAGDLRPRIEQEIGKISSDDLDALFAPHDIPWSFVEEAGAIYFPAGAPAATGGPPELDAHGDALRAEFSPG